MTPDPHFQIWATALDAQFPGRTHVLVATLEEAFVRLDERRGSGAGREA